MVWHASAAIVGLVLAAVACFRFENLHIGAWLLGGSTLLTIVVSTAKLCSYIETASHRNVEAIRNLTRKAKR